MLLSSIGRNGAELPDLPAIYAFADDNTLRIEASRQEVIEWTTPLDHSAGTIVSLFG